MATSSSIEKLIQHAQCLKFDPLKRRRVIDGLKYLLTQSLCDLDRRHPDHHIQSCFKSVEESARGTNLPQMPGWRELQIFVGVMPDFIEKPQASRQQSKYDSWSVEQFFDYLAEQVRTKRLWKTEKDTELFFALTVLRDQAKLVRYRRDYRTISATWKKVLLLTKGTKLFVEFKGSEKMRSTLRSFLRESVV